MPARTNLLKRMLREGKPSVGLFHSLGSPLAAELLGHAGFDWIVVDGEHSTNDVISVRDQLVALDATGVPAVVRLVEGRTHLIKQFMDAGAQTLLVPMVDSVEYATALVRAMRYPPEGIRGVASGTRAGQFGLAADYLSTANQEACLIIQIESKKALDNLDALLGVDGIDCLFIGPSDLAADMGHLGNPGHPDVQGAIEKALKRIRGAGRSAGIYVGNADTCRKYVDWGANFLAVGTDLGILAKAVSGVARELRAVVG